jgi:hypothetical protein
MKLSLRRTGGFAGIALNAAVDTSTLPPGEAQEVERMAAQLSKSAPPPPRNPQARDAFTYELRAGDQTYRADDTSMPAEWRPLVDWLIDHAS